MDSSASNSNGKRPVSTIEDLSDESGLGDEAVEAVLTERGRNFYQPFSEITASKQHCELSNQSSAKKVELKRTASSRSRPLPVTTSTRGVVSDSEDDACAESLAAGGASKDSGLSTDFEACLRSLR